jgi:hypothetical protein
MVTSYHVVKMLADVVHRRKGCRPVTSPGDRRAAAPAASDAPGADIFTGEDRVADLGRLVGRLAATTGVAAPATTFGSQPQPDVSVLRSTRAAGVCGALRYGVPLPRRGARRSCD